jgi:hypothetical protein
MGHFQVRILLNYQRVLNPNHLKFQGWNKPLDSSVFRTTNGRHPFISPLQNGDYVGVYWIYLRIVNV